jgi:hypothetical protein
MKRSQFTRVFIIVVLALVISLTAFQPGVSTAGHQSFDSCGGSLDSFVIQPLIGWNSLDFVACPMIGWNT